MKMVVYQCKGCKKIFMINFTDDEEEYLDTEYTEEEKILPGLCCPNCVGGTVIELGETDVMWEGEV